MAFTSKRSWCWEYFREEKVNNKSIAYCKFCGDKYTGGITARMEKHLLKKCRKVGVEAREIIESRSKSKKCDSSFSSSIQSPLNRLQPLSSSSSQNSNIIQSPLFSPQGSSSQGPLSVRTDSKISFFMDSISPDEQQELDILLTRTFTTAGNVADNLLDNPFFQQFLAKLRPSYKIPTRKYKFPKVLIPAEFDRVKKMVDRATNSADFVAITSDGWTDVNNSKIINFIVHTPTPYHFNSVDATIPDHTGHYIAQILSEQIEKIGKNKVVGIITDHASNMRSAWTILSRKYPWLIMQGCKAHMLHLAAEDLCKTTEMKQIIEKAVKIVKFFRKKTSQLELAFYQEREFGKSKILQLPAKTRWGTYSKMFELLSQNKCCLKQAVWAQKCQEKFPSEIAVIREIVMDEQFWIDLENLDNIFKPLARAIVAIQSNVIVSSVAYGTIDGSFNECLNSIALSNLHNELKSDLMEKLEQRREFGHSNLAVLIDFLDPKKMNSVNYDGAQKAIELVNEKLIKNPLFSAHKTEVLTELAHWRARSGKFSIPERPYAWELINETEVDLITWWKGFFGETWIAKIVTAISHIPVTTSATERNWFDRQFYIGI